jgi:hypothetical protein
VRDRFEIKQHYGTSYYLRGQTGGTEFMGLSGFTWLVMPLIQDYGLYLDIDTIANLVWLSLRALIMQLHASSG